MDELADHLERHGHSARPYHAGLEDDERRRNQEAFIRDDVQIIVATIAFGMGINKPNVRFVMHYDLPKSIEGYYQEIGRAGRDGLPAHCLLLYSYSDVAKLNYFIDQKEGTERQVAMQHLDAIVRYAEDEINCRRKPLLNYFGEPYAAQNCRNCDNCTAEAIALTDITIPAQKFLSCVKRTGERFGAAHVTDVLLGSKGERILRLGHDQLSTYGIGGELTKKQWMHLARQLVQMGYLNQEGEYRTLSLTPKADAALKKRTPILGQLQEVEERASKKANQAGAGIQPRPVRPAARQTQGTGRRGRRAALRHLLRPDAGGDGGLRPAVPRAPAGHLGRGPGQGAPVRGGVPGGPAAAYCRKHAIPEKVKDEVPPHPRTTPAGAMSWWPRPSTPGKAWRT